MQAAQARAYLETLDRQARHYTTTATPQGKVVWRSWGEGPPLVMLHGGSGAWTHWVRNIEALARERTLWVPDLPGMGESDLPREGLDADSIAPLVLDGLDELLKGASFELLGFSFGGLVSCFMAALAVEKVERMVLSSITGLGVRAGPRHPLLPLRGITDPAEREAVLRNNLTAMMIYDADRVDALAVAVQDGCVQRDRVRDRKVASSDAILRVAPDWRCPVYGIWGERDSVRHRDVAAFEAATARLGLRERHIIPDATHWVPYEAAEAFNPLVLRLLSAR